MSALVPRRLNRADASGGAVTLTLPTGQTEGTELSVEKVDTSANVVSITGSIRGVGASTITLKLKNEAITFRADSTGSWYPLADHKTLSSLDGRFVPQAASGDAVGSAPVKQADGSTKYANPSADLKSRAQGYGNYKGGSAVVLAPFHATLANRNVLPVTIACVWDSFGAGTGSTSEATRIINQLQQIVRERFPVTDVIGGRGYHPGNGQLGGPTTSGPGVTAVNLGPGNRASKLTAATDRLVYGSQVGNKVRIWGIALTAADSFTVTIGGVVQETFAPGATGWFVRTYTLPNRGSYLVQIDWVAGTPVVTGERPYDGDDTLGISVLDYSKGGAKSADWLADTDWLNWLDGTRSIPAPDLFLFGAIANDAPNITAAQHKINVQAVITAIRTKSSAPIVLLLQHRRNPAITTTVDPWSSYVTADYELANSNAGVTVCDLDPLVDITATGMTGGSSPFVAPGDTYHPSNLGSSTEAVAIADFILPNGEATWTGMVTTPFTTFAPQRQARGSFRVFGDDPAAVTARVVPTAGQTANAFEVVLATDASTPTLIVDKAGRTIGTSLTARGNAAGSAGAGFTIDGNAGQIRDHIWATTASAGAVPSNRFIMRTDGTAESGANAGSNFLFMSRDDTGAAIKTIFSVVRSSSLVTWGDGVNFGFGTTTGTQIGTASTHKLGFWGRTPIAQPSRVGALTDSSGGSATSTIADVGAAFSQAGLNNIHASLAAKINALELLIHNEGLSA